MESNPAILIGVIKLSIRENQQDPLNEIYK